MEVTATKSEAEIIEGKKAAWAQMGVSIHQTEMQLQAMAQKALADVKIPTTFNEVNDATAKLTELKREQKNCETVRKNITSKFDALATRMSGPEKSFEPVIKELTDAIIVVKKAEQDRITKDQKAEQERAAVKEKVLKFMNDKDYEFKSFIAGRVSYALTYALGEGNINPETLDKFIEACAQKYDVKQFNTVFPGYSANHITSTEVSNIVGEHFKWDAQSYVDLYREELKKKFADFHIQFANKEQALELAKKEDIDKQNALVAEKENKDLSASIEANAVPLATLQTSTVKGLKSEWSVDMPETIESVIAIMAAFIANRSLCEAKLRVNKWFSFTPTQAATALAKVKNDDPNFAPQGINFKEVSKL